MAAIAPATLTVGETQEAGEVTVLDTLGLAWGSTVEGGTRPEELDAFDDGRGVWLLHEEEAELAFVWRGTTPEDADFFAHQFVKLATRAACRSNPSGNRVLHFAIEIDGVARTARLYLDGRIVPDAGSGSDNALRSLYTFRVPGSVVYPVLDVESLDDATGLMNVVLEVNGQRTALADITEA